MDLQRINAKVLVGAGADFDVSPILHVFSRWRHEDSVYDWLDLADYAHVPEGPLAMIVGETGNFVFDAELESPGFLYRNKKGLTGTVEERLKQTLARLVDLLSDMAKAPEFGNALDLSIQRLVVTINDRVNFPNSDQTDSAVGAGFKAALHTLFEGTGLEIVKGEGAGRLYTVVARASTPIALSEAQSRLGKVSVDTPQAKAPVEPKFVRVSAVDSAKLVSSGHVYLDVRTEEEFNESHPEGAFNIPVMITDPAVGMRPNPDFVSVVSAHFDKHAPIVLGCRSGGRSQTAARLLLEAGYTDLTDNRSGFLQGVDPEGRPEAGWSQAGLPTSSTPQSGRSYPELKGA
ncbi:MAG: hypothetical protein KC561_17430 [Myxococcales bacterium]|nr:hypothetical protein [Myxococcales bacterium]